MPYVFNTDTVYVLTKLKENISHCNTEIKNLIDIWGLDEKFLKTIFFGKGIEEVGVKFCGEYSYVMEKVYRSIDIATFYHISLEEKAEEEFEKEVTKSEKRKEEMFELAKYLSPYLYHEDIFAAIISGSLGDTRYPAKGDGIDYIIFTEKDLKHLFKDFFLPEKKVSEVTYITPQFTNMNGIEKIKSNVLKKKGNYPINIYAINPEAWKNIFKRMKSEMVKACLRYVEDSFPIHGKKFLKEFYNEVKL